MFLSCRDRLLCSQWRDRRDRSIVRSDAKRAKPRDCKHERATGYSEIERVCSSLIAMSEAHIAAVATRCVSSASELEAVCKLRDSSMSAWLLACRGRVANKRGLELEPDSVVLEYRQVGFVPR